MTTSDGLVEYWVEHCFNMITDSYDEEYFEKGTKSGYRCYSTSIHMKIQLNSIAFIRALAIKFFLNPKTVLDVGCAGGEMVKFLKKMGVNALGIDISRYVISKSNDKIRPYLVRGNAVDLPFKNLSFDVVTTFDVLEHCPRQFLKSTILECQRVSKKYIFHRICTVDTLWHKIFGHPDSTHVSMFSKKQWKRIFKKLKLTESSKFFPKFQTGGWFLLEKT